MSGPGNVGGTFFQARVAAYVAVHILAEEPLLWAELSIPDRPVALTGEVPGPGDDLRIQLAGTDVELDVQSKHGLRRPKLLEWTVLVAERLPNADHLRVVLAVDPSSALAIRTHLRNDLRRLRGGLDGDLHEVTDAVRTRMAGVCGGRDAANALLSRVHVMALDLDNDSSESRKTAVTMLRRVLHDEHRAEDAWSHLESECHQLCRDRRRRDYESWVRLLNARGIRVRSTQNSAPGAPRTTPVAPPHQSGGGVLNNARAPDATPPNGGGERSHRRNPQLQAPPLDYGATSPRRLGTWRSLRAAAGGMTPGEGHFTRLAAVGALTSAAFTIPTVALWNYSPGLHSAAVTFGCGAVLATAAAFTPVGLRFKRLRDAAGIPCPSGCGGAWAALDAAEVFRTRGRLGAVQSEWSAWVPCPVYGDDPAHRVAVACPLALGVMLDALNGHRLDAEREALVSGVSNKPDDQAEARVCRRFASDVAALLNEGVASAVDPALLTTYREYLALYAHQPWPRRNREALLRLIVLLEIRASQES